MFIDDHLDRFERSSHLLHLHIPATRTHLKESILEIARLNFAPVLGIKLIITGGYSSDGYEPTTPNLIILAKPLILLEKPLKLLTYSHQRELPEIKSLNYLTPISLLPTLKAAKADDVLFHYNNLLLESSRSNIFIVKGEKIITPAHFILKGITRQKLIDKAKTIFEVEERPVRMEELWGADEVFITGSSKRVAEVVQVDNHIFSDGKMGVITAKMKELVTQ